MMIVGMCSLSGDLHENERMAYSLALSEGKSPALGIKLLLFGAENSGKTCLVSTMTGVPYDEETATKGADLSIINTANWVKISSEELCGHLQQKFLRDLRDSAVHHKNLDTSDELPQKKAITQPSFSRTLSKLFPTFSSTLSSIVSPPEPAKQIPKAYVSEIKQAIETDPVANNEINVTILDFAGQDMYHTTHSVFIRKDNIIMVVFNASQPLSSNVKVRLSTLRSDPMTNSENVHFWMKTVHSICHVSGDENDKADLLPVILLVATHLDLLGDSAEQTKEDIIQQLVQEFKEKPYARHLAGHREGLDQALRKYCIFISNKCRNLSEVARLQNTVKELAQPILSKEHPVVFLKIERTLLSLEKATFKVEEFHAITVQCGFPAALNSREFIGALEYFHNCGTVLYFPFIESLQRLVILSPHWLTKFISYVILAHPYKCIGGRLDISFRYLIEKGILLGSFLSHMLNLFNNSETATSFDVDTIKAVDLLKKFHFVASISSGTSFLEEKDTFYQEKNLLIVPTLLPEDPDNKKKIPSEDDPNVRIVYYYFPDCFISPTIYTNMIAECINCNEKRRQDLIW